MMLMFPSGLCANSSVLPHEGSEDLAKNPLGRMIARGSLLNPDSEGGDTEPELIPLYIDN
jgi:hypothetical protein